MLICFIFIVSYYNTYMNSYKESFNSEKHIFILLGDSILKNDAYVSNGASLHYLLLERTNNKTYCYALDDSKIIDVYKQIDEIPYNFNNIKTTIFLSAGGNDILEKYVENSDRNSNISSLEDIFTKYIELIKSIQTKLPNANIILLDIYYPDNEKYKQYHKIISDWNNMIYDYARETKNKITSVLKISNILTQTDDFTSDIEPSASGSQKIVDIILSSY